MQHGKQPVRNGGNVAETEKSTAPLMHAGWGAKCGLDRLPLMTANEDAVRQ